MLGALKFIPRDELEKESSEKPAKKRKHHKDRGKGKIKSRGKKKRQFEDDTSDSSSDSDDIPDRTNEDSAQGIREDAKSKRREAGMEWMLKAPERLFDKPATATPKAAEDHPTLDSERPQVHPRELNPYVSSGTEESGVQRLPRPPPPPIGDGGASWRLKALKRAQEQAAREGRQLDEVVEERWGSLATLTSSVAVKRSAHANAHLHAIRDRKSRNDDETVDGEEKTFQRPERGFQGENRDRGRDRDQVSRMRVPRVDPSLSWKSKKKYDNQSLRAEDAAIIRAAATTMNKFSNDGSFLKNFKPEGPAVADDHPVAEEDSSVPPRGQGERLVDKTSADIARLSRLGGIVADDADAREDFSVPSRGKDELLAAKTSADIARLSRLGGIVSDDSSSDTETAPQKKLPDPPVKNTTPSSSAGLSANQVAAKAMRLRLMGKVEEAEKLTKDYEADVKEKRVSKPPTQDDTPHFVQSERQGSGRGAGMNLNSVKPRDKIRDRNQSYDAELAGSISRNKLYKGNVDDEYDYGDGCDMEGSRGKKGKPARPSVRPRVDGVNRISTQQERCQFCFENADRPKHLVIAMANSTYLMIPPRTSLVPFHCFIVPMQHEGATRNVDESVWQELRNFKKCLVQMFAKQGKEVLFLETAMELARQRRHCYIECIPVPSDAAKDAPLYFKKAIDEAEDEWSQHNSKKLIDTRQKGLRNSIPKNFPYFHVEFGMKGGYAHVIDDESTFKAQFGIDVVAGILELPEEDTYGHRRPDTYEQQKRKAAEFLKLWDPFDWTKMLD
ncbi:hypothetical protein AXG93_1520s1150 [Marchantia polymorpha subsp. ruderalis]|uniref:Cwf19-like C-terminal domain-containing protein n=1 Tax=Marchantia polymorpha subsp. ruderalis TaxID=1480154 RepID=A0A176VHV4_MARPO|nr:hypothetical protein AXG93_1520s1150 [Marchantia polymorpha subsp. ruderalis]